VPFLGKKGGHIPALPFRSGTGENDLTTASSIGIDLGATKVLACVVDETGVVRHQRAISTPHDGLAPLVDAVVDVTRQLRGQGEAGAVGISVAGWVDRDRRTVLFTPHMHLPWQPVPLTEMVSERLGSDVVLENDANAAAWGEFTFGAGREFNDVAVVTVGSGIGAGFIVDGKLLRGAHGMAGEFGHSVFDPNGPDCPCGRRGCVDSFTSGHALERRFEELHRTKEATAARAGPGGGAAVPFMTGEAIAAAARDGDPVALQAFSDIGALLGMAIADLAMYLDPQAVILSGGVASAGELLRRPTDKALQEGLAARGEEAATYLLTGTLGPAAGAIGIAHLASIGRPPALRRPDNA
jgi:glucokinase